ncbi:Undecaprenyl phosphate-alpha-4-amino-4-deoxy-L-arabinose arabinosyl transferase [Polystyrenella longa]|uniref:Undecaprenyl phosphate-alpha-4-amino-4-deoxy-L-arabinose arabinosyl transferase n=1 Tax=Polystyrenella longa TaxID=2528007 RepID=A0A518CRU8_9PLAN|nr:glycosyltransferase family 39 protein [Polystyrenella longa]QDU81945.1 Undecaprenyl phosphate-alpha-4-amino-4-deoxy-L-arabinose arabinosyl transferase [Polystyrenella longa]
MTAERHADLTSSSLPFYRKLSVQAGALFLIGTFVLFYNLAGYRTFSSHEGFAVVPAQEMLESGNYVVPYYAGVPRLKKPPLVYWVLSASATIFGDLNEWTARFPQAIATLLLAGLMFHWGSQWYGRKVGIAAAFIQLTAIYVLDFGRKAEIDMTLCLLTTSAMYLIATSKPHATYRDSFLRITAIYALLSISWLGKFHYGPVMVIAPTVLFFLVQKRYRDFLKILNPVGILIAAAAICLWPYLVLQQYPEAWDVWMSETAGRAVGELGREPIWYYVPHILTSMLPWSLFVIAALVPSWKKAWMEKNANERFLWIWFIVQVVIMSSQANKHKHYLMSLLPLLSLMAGTQLVRMESYLPPVGRFFTRWRAAAFAVVVATGTYYMIDHKWPWMRTSAALLGFTLASGFLISRWLTNRGKIQASVTAIVLMGLAAYLIANSQIIPGRDHRASAARFANEMRRELGPQPEITTYNMNEWHSFMFYLGNQVQRLESPDSVNQYIRNHGSADMLAFETDLEELTQVAQYDEIREMTWFAEEPAPRHPRLVWIRLTSPADTTNQVAQLVDH